MSSDLEQRVQYVLGLSNSVVNADEDLTDLEEDKPRFVTFFFTIAIFLQCFCRKRRRAKKEGGKNIAVFDDVGNISKKKQKRIRREVESKVCDGKINCSKIFLLSLSCSW